MGNVQNIKIPINGQKLHISVKIEVNTMRSFNYHSSSDQVHPRNNLSKTSRRIYRMDRLSQTYKIIFLWKIDLKQLDMAII